MGITFIHLFIGVLAITIVFTLVPSCKKTTEKQDWMSEMGYFARVAYFDTHFFSWNTNIFCKSAYFCPAFVFTEPQKQE